MRTMRMGSQSQVPQQAQARPLATHAQNANNGIGDALAGAGSQPWLPSLSSISAVTSDELQHSVLNQDPGQAFVSTNINDFLPGQAFVSTNISYDFLRTVWTMDEQQTMAQMVPVGSDGGEEFGRAESDPPVNGSDGNVWTMDEQQTMAQMVPVGSDGGEEFGRAESDPPVNGSGGGGSLPRQPSLLKQPSMPVALPRTLSRKNVDEVTVDEVFRDIVNTNPSLDPHGGNGAREHVSTAAGAGVKDGKTNYGEMTREQFSVKSGVVKDGENVPNDLASLNLVFRSQMQAQVQSQAHTHAKAQAQGPEWTRDFQQRQQRLFQAQPQARQAQAQAQAAEKEVESKKRRRESSTRSRAKKQVYITELEAKVTKMQVYIAELEAKVTKQKEDAELEAKVTKMQVYIAELEAKVTKQKEEIRRELRRALVERGCGGQGR